MGKEADVVCRHMTLVQIARCNREAAESIINVLTLVPREMCET